MFSHIALGSCVCRNSNKHVLAQRASGATFTLASSGSCNEGVCIKLNQQCNFPLAIAIKCFISKHKLLHMHGLKLNRNVALFPAKVIKYNYDHFSQVTHL